ncbi:putative F-box protein [Cardamine amara subsp. amara]|uniref:F-box protein n=1 Tax=Cardamine amara subsp. amara TaxID=228776 RepID=A0ABD1B6T5_CARAN
MRKRQKHVSEEENCHTHKSSSTSLDISEVIPIDLFFDIFSRLPHKTIAKCCFVSKLWYSILSRPDFIDLIFKRSSAHPRLLFAFKSFSSNWSRFFSSPQPVKPDENLPLLAVDDGIRACPWLAL